MTELPLEIEQDRLQKLQVMAKREGCSVQEKLEQIVRQYLDKLAEGKETRPGPHVRHEI